MSATSGMRICRLISPSFSAASRTGTAHRTMSQPAASSDQISSNVACTSRVSVFVIDCTVSGAPPPTLTLPTWICLLVRRVIIRPVLWEGAPSKGSPLPLFWEGAPSKGSPLPVFWEGAPSKGSPLPLQLSKDFEGVEPHEIVVERVDHQQHQQHEPHALGGLPLLQRQWSLEHGLDDEENQVAA